MKKKLEENIAWNQLRPQLNNSYNYNNDWEKAITLFKTRLNEKFFDPLELIINENKLQGEGFAIVTVQCAIIESLASFRTGRIFSHKKIKGQPKYIYNESRTMFIDFLHTAPVFKDNFYYVDAGGKKTKDSPFNADQFYSHVRCGLLHEARTKEKWIIKATSKDASKDSVFLKEQGKEIVVFRTVLHYRLKACVATYVDDLKQANTDGEKLRRFFARKLDHLFDIPPDAANYDWWIDR